MTQILASGKTGAQRYANNDLAKPVAALDMIQIGQQTQRASEETLGWSYSNEEGSADSQPASSLKPITAANVGDYDPYLAQIIQTYVANNSYLECSGTANAISLAPRKIADIASPDTTNYAKATSLPFTFRDNLRFTFRATNTNTAATQITIPALAGLSGSIDVVDEAGANLVGGEIIAGKFYEIITTGTSGTKKLILKTISIADASTTAKGIVELLTNAELAAGTDTTRAATAAAIASLFGTSLRSANGYARLPVKVGGAFVEIIAQWGSSTNTGTSTAVVFPLAFLTITPIVQITCEGSVGLTARGPLACYKDATQSGFNWGSESGGATVVSGGAVAMKWFAIGY